MFLVVPTTLSLSSSTCCEFASQLGSGGNGFIDELSVCLGLGGGSGGISSLNAAPDVVKLDTFLDLI